MKSVRACVKLPVSLTVTALSVAPMLLLAQGIDTEPQLVSLFAQSGSENATNPASDPMRIPDRMKGKVVLRAPAAAPRIDPAIEPPPVDLTQRTFAVDAIPVLDGADVNVEHLAQVMEPWSGKALSFDEFQLAANDLLTFLRENGHPDAVLRFSQMQFMDNQQVAVAIEGLKAVAPYQDATPKIQVAGFDINGVTLLTEAEVAEHMAQWSDRELTVQELSEATESLARLLRDRGYALAQAWLPPQDIRNGIVRVEVLEGVVDEMSGNNGLTVAGNDARLKTDVASAYLAQAVKPGEPLDVTVLEEQVRLLNDLPGVKRVQTDLKPGTQPGTTQVVAQVEDDDLVNVLLTADNHGSEYSGAERVSANINLNSPTGHGEQLFVNVTEAESSRSYKVGGHVPVGYSGLRLGLSHAAMSVDFDLAQGFSVPINIASESSATSLFASYPLKRSAQTNMDLYASLDFKNYQNSILYGAVENDRDITSASLGFSGDNIDRFNGQTRWGLTLTQGSIGLEDGSSYQFNDAQGARTEGSFTKLNYSLQRYQSLPLDDLFFNASLNGQWASGNLDSAEKFQLGGPDGVRAWPVGEGIGDNGWVANLELRQILSQPDWGRVEAFGFYDVGGITQYADLNPGIVYDGPNDYTLDGYGVGLSVTYGESGSLQLVYAHKGKDNPNPTPEGTDSDGKSDQGRLWLTGKILF
ncbi:MAG: ShlB/FhaC/HecB family hemolysin secretion/activation protein [Oceanospirillales bacterium]|nr:ShlB/FhaC/HecB family hemolysin secretion/activation protein [Oceanospirillales bacterium]MBR9886754.1 ShlB/FhaC/HecB family hemolysin secretion/activation protein [Oceanospirillales bacterium]